MGPFTLSSYRKNDDIFGLLFCIIRWLDFTRFSQGLPWWSCALSGTYAPCFKLVEKVRVHFALGNLSQDILGITYVHV